MDGGDRARFALGLVAPLGEQLVYEVPVGLLSGEQTARAVRDVTGFGQPDARAFDLEHELRAFLKPELAPQRRGQNESAAFTELNGVADVGHIDSMAQF
jgi:hypothetical protein